MSTKRKTLVFVLVLAILIGAGAFWYMQHNGGKNQTTVPVEAPRSIRHVTVIHPKSAARTIPFTYNVRVEPVEQASLFARADGFVKERLVDIGDTVKAGQLLARLSSPELEDGIRQVKADMRRQQAVIRLASQMLDRAKALKESGAVSKSEYDGRHSDYSVGVATQATLKAKLEQLENEYAYTHIVAPFDGRITVRNIERGDRISKTDTTPLFRIVRDDTLRVVVDIPQTQIYAIDATGEAKLALPELAGQAFPLTYDRTSHEVDPTLGTMRMEFLLDNRELRLPAGVAGEISISPAKDSTILTVPDNSIRMHDAKTVVMIIDAQNRAHIRPIVTGRYTTTMVEALSGLTAEDRVILNPNALLKPGETVEVDSDKSPAGKS
jgi:RND family efflux transporter MFP subunit